MKSMIVCDRGQRNFKIYDDNMVFEQLVRGHRKPVLSGVCVCMCVICVFVCDVMYVMCVMCVMCVMYVCVCVKCVCMCV